MTIYMVEQRQPVSSKYKLDMQEDCLPQSAQKSGNPPLKRMMLSRTHRKTACKGKKQASVNAILRYTTINSGSVFPFKACFAQLSCHFFAIIV